MERLHFGSNERYVAIEAAVHLARYSMARPVAAGKRVLDIACGEGYGAYALATRWNATHVTALDIAPEAIASAKHNFSADNIKFDVASAYDLSKIFPENSFDLIVSFETIEHLEDPELFLREIRRVAAPDATIIISCPNDARHYDKGDEGNPFHMRTFTSSEFFGLTESVLGRCSRKFIGTPILGFGNYALGTENLNVGRNPIDMVRGNLEPSIAALTVAPDDRLEMDNSSYYVGVWGGLNDFSESENIAVYPCDMKSAAQASLSDEIGRLRTQVWDLQHAEKFVTQTSESNTSLREKSEKILYLEAENTTLRENVRRLEIELDASEIQRADMSSAMHDEMERVRRQLRNKALKIETLTAENAIARESIRIQRARADAGDLAYANLITQTEADKITIQRLQDLVEANKIHLIELQTKIAQDKVALAAIPWRVVGLYRRIRRIMPNRILTISANIIDKARRL